MWANMKYSILHWKYCSFKLVTSMLVVQCKYWSSLMKNQLIVDSNGVALLLTKLERMQVAKENNDEMNKQENKQYLRDKMQNNISWFQTMLI